MLKKLIKLSDYLDLKNFTKEADYLDQIIKKYSQMSFSEYSKVDDSKKDDSKVDEYFFEDEYSEIINMVADYENDGQLGFRPGTAKELKEKIDKFIAKYIGSDKLNSVRRKSLMDAKKFIDEQNKEYYEANRERSPLEKKMDKNIEKYRGMGAKIIPYGRPREELGGRQVHYAVYDASNTQKGKMTSGMKMIQVVDLRNEAKMRNEEYGYVNSGYDKLYEILSNKF